MLLPFQILLGLLTLLIVVAVVWRLLSRRASHPCPSWLAWLVELENPIATSYNSRNIIQRLSLQPGMRVLDAGCGPGRVTIPLARAVGPEGMVVAIDIQTRMLERAKAKAEAAGLHNIEFRQQAIESGALEEKSFDRALLVTVLGEIPNREAALREIGHALAPGGFLSVTEIGFDPHYQSRGAILKAAGPAGLRERGFFGNRFAFTLHLEHAGSRGGA
jgi:SAM-dependent methyltransferase